MRFRRKFGLLDCGYLALGALMAFFLVIRGHHEGRLPPWVAVAWIALALHRLLLRAFVSWDIAPDGLVERRFWKQRKIAWNQIVSVSPWPHGKPSGRYVAIGFARSAPLSERGQVIGDPGDLDGFLREMRKHAPQARFDLLPAEMLVAQS